jgi:hypothetical protein
MDGDEPKLKDKKEYQVNILDLFKGEYTETSSACKMMCPSCLLQGNRTEGFILFPESNTAYCHSSGKHFKMLEAYALRKKIIRCLDGRESGDNNTKILGGELFTLTLNEFKNEYGTDMYNKLIADLNIRKSIELPGNNRYVSDFADEMGDIYKTRNVLFFRGESRDIVEVGRYRKIDQEGKEYYEKGFMNVNGNRFITLAEMFVKPWTMIFTKSGTSMIVNKSMSSSHATVTLESPNFQDKLPVLTRIFDIQIPIIDKKTKRLTFPKKGYDKRFGSWLPYNAPQIKEGMYSLEDAKGIINRIFEEFCFATDKDRTYAIAGFMTPFLRGLFPTFSTRTPVFIYMANRERAGKDFCAGCTGILYEGSNVEEPAISNDEKGSSNEEIRKKITACLIQGKKRFHSSNNKGLLNNSIFEGVTTAETWNDRLLGKSMNVTFSNEMDYSLSGNVGIRLTPDLSNRSRIINLHLVEEDANARVFNNADLHGWILNNRMEIISALYTIVKNWVDKGMPNGSVPFTSFPHWAKICGGIMEAAGYDNPCCKDTSAIISLDIETEDMKHLFEICFDKRPNEWLEKKDIQAIIENEGIMTYLDYSKPGDKIKFGLKIDKYVNRILSGILMTPDSLASRANRRKYKFSSNLPKSIWSNNDLKPENSNGIDGIVGIVQPVVRPITIVKVLTIGETIPTLPTVPTFYPKNEKNDENSKCSTQISIIPKCSTQISKSLEEYSKMGKEFVKSEIESKLKKPKTDRELQFWESPETSDMVEECTKEQALEWVKNNPGIDFKKMYKILGRGSFRYLYELMEEGLIKRLYDGWEENNV